MRRLRTETYQYGSWTYIIQTDFAAGLSARYTVYRLDAWTQHCRIVARELPLRKARRMFPGKRVS